MGALLPVLFPVPFPALPAALPRAPPTPGARPVSVHSLASGVLVHRGRRGSATAAVGAARWGPGGPPVTQHRPIPPPSPPSAHVPDSGSPPLRVPPRDVPHRQPVEETERRRDLGRFGEACAARHLVGRGMVLLDRNWRCDAGEIDLVLRDGRVLVVCEVKTRSTTAFGSPLEAVSEAKAARLRRLAARWLAAHRLRPDDVRIDLVGVLVPHGGAPSVEHVRGVG